MHDAQQGQRVVVPRIFIDEEVGQYDCNTDVSAECRSWSATFRHVEQPAQCILEAMTVILGDTRPRFSMKIGNDIDRIVVSVRSNDQTRHFERNESIFSS